MNLWLKWARLDPVERRHLLEAVIWLLIGFVATRVIPFRHVARLLGEPKRRSPLRISGKQSLHAGRTGWAVRTAARNLPGHWPCLAQAFAAKQMLRRRKVPSTVYLGVAKGGSDRFKAHAWLWCGGAILTGRENAAGYTVISTFAER